MHWILAVVKTGFRQQMTFKKAMLLGAFASVIYAAIRIVVLNTLYEDRASVSGLNYEQVVTWAVLSGMFMTLIWTPWSHELPQAIRSGEVASDLLRPVNSFSLQLARQAGRMLALALIRVVPFIVVGSLLLPMSAPGDAGAYALLIVSLVAMTTAGLGYGYLTGITAFFTADYHVWMAFGFYTIQLLGGVYVPLEFIPGPLGTFVRWGPGMAFMAAPTRILNGIEPGQTLMIQLFWMSVICLAAYAGLHRGRKRLVVFGG